MENGTDRIFDCFAAAECHNDPGDTAESFVDVEEYENSVMYPEFARWADKAGFPEIAKLFRKVAGEEGEHSVWLRELYQDMGAPREGKDTERAKDALGEVRAACEKMAGKSPRQLVEDALKVAIRVETREYNKIYPAFRDQALAAGRTKDADVYQRVIDSERQHAQWFGSALKGLRASAVSA